MDCDSRSRGFKLCASKQDRKKDRDRREIGLPWSILIIPLLFVLAGLALPYALLAAPLQRRRERAFLAQMKARNRFMGWPDFQRAVDEARGTLIVTYTSPEEGRAFLVEDVPP